VSPNKKDVASKWIAPKQYERHPAHYLTETQVRFGTIPCSSPTCGCTGLVLVISHILLYEPDIRHLILRPEVNVKVTNCEGFNLL
jgi:hypothetical protein